jgi:hypothetical protein
MISREQWPKIAYLILHPSQYVDVYLCKIWDLTIYSRRISDFISNSIIFLYRKFYCYNPNIYL